MATDVNRDVIATHRELRDSAGSNRAAKPEVELTLLERYTALTELTSEELIARGEQLIKLGQKLAVIGMGTLPAEEPERQTVRSVGRLGVVDERVAIEVARTLGEFDRPAFAEALGLKVGAATSKWLTVLLHHVPPIIDRREDGVYAYIPPPKSRKPRQRRPAPELELIDQSPARGQPIPVEPTRRAQKRDRSVLSRPGQGHQIRQAQKRYEKTTGGNPKEAGKAARRKARQTRDTQRNGKL